ncbi:SusC/RagA family TonB-linked outer membrane protein [Parabacteroides goldsteinii]|nr:SusC/RagA family TonB-linked outer membrane protein [Parabacteroides goldsteinii]GKG79785.1 SusC/RagA family TonB-linked outer membrane protein [Parabacteroides goldsteinii]
MLADTLPIRPSVNITQQNGKVTVIVEDDFGPVTGASVVVKGTTNGNVTDLDGKVVLEDVKNGATIQISFVGYTTQEVKYTGNPNLNIKLQEDSQALDEVVVTGFAGVQKTKTLTAAAVNVKVESIAKLPVTSPSDGLGGRVSGIITQARSGAPGETSKIWIRGGSQILYVIDDVVMETEQGEVFFNRLRPDDIASMSILKDASATAVYGPRAKDGVVVVTTKKGQEGMLEISVSQKMTMMTPSYKFKPMSTWDYVNKKNELYAASMAESPAYNATEMSKYYMYHLSSQGYGRQEITDMVNQKYGLGYTLDEINDYFNPFKTQGGDIENYYGNYDPWDWFDHVQPMSQTNVSVRGGSERVRYYSSLGYMNQSGISDSYNYEQYNAIVNTDAYLLKDKSLKFTLNLNGVMAKNKKPYGGDNIFNNVLIEDNEMNNIPRNWTTGLERNNSLDARLRTGFNNTDDYRLQSNIGLKWSLPWVEGLSVSTSVNFNYSNSMNKTFEHPQIGVYSAPYSTQENSYNPNNAKLSQTWNNYSLTTGIVQADYVRSFGKHNLSAMLNYTSQKRRTNSTMAKKYGYPAIYNTQIDGGSTMDSMNGDEGLWGSASLVGRVTYDYDSKYMLQLSANYNGSLCYHPDKRWGFFYAASAGWMLTEETFIKDILNTDLINSFKIRAGYGIVGNELSKPFSYMNQYGLSKTILLGENMGASTAWTETNVSSNLTWGESQQISGGVDFSFLKDRLSGSFDTYLYLNKGDEIDMNPELTYTPILGLPNTPKMNAPYVTTHKGGVEFSLNWNDRIGDFTYRVGANYTHWEEVTVRHADKSTDYYYANLNDLGVNAHAETYNISWQTNGIFTSYDDMYNSYLHFKRNHTVGTFRMDDRNGDGVLGIADYAYNEGGGTTPQTLYGITLGMGWKDFSFEVFFQGATSVSGDVTSPARSQQDYYWKYGKYLFQESYTPSNPITNKLPLPTNSSYGWGYNYVDVWGYDASYLKLKNISVSYDLKRRVLKNVDYIKGLSVNFIANNVCTWVKKSNPFSNMTDPEYLPANSIWGGNKLGSYPTQRSFTLSATLTL